MIQFMRKFYFQRHILLGTFLWVFLINLLPNYYFYIQFSHKKNTPYRLDRPEAFLSEKALARRIRERVAVDSTDLPVNPEFLQQLLLQNVTIHSTTRWLNGATIVVSDSSLVQNIRTLPFVQFAQYTGRTYVQMPIKRSRAKWNSESLHYGQAGNQILQLNGNALHRDGFTGQGVTIAVLDAGFMHVDVNAAFDSLRMQNRLLSARNKVQSGIDPFTQHPHGSHVLSTMAANIPGVFMGTAPHANYVLIQTEYAPTEYLREVDFWVAGLEYADSIGADVVNSSLGYTQFDDSTMDYQYADMTGNVSRASIAATMAANKGMLVCNSVGNSGASLWQFVGAPADAKGILAVGAVTNTGAPAWFSSFGPSADGRIKPEVAAQGVATALVGVTGLPISGNGTSFSSPLIAGLAACLIQFSKQNLREYPGVAAIREAIVASSSHFQNPQPQLGYGIPDFGMARQWLQLSNPIHTVATNTSIMWFVQQNEVTFSTTNRKGTMGLMRIFNATGIPVSAFTLHWSNPKTLRLKAGIYVYRFTCGESYESGKFRID